MKMQLKRAEDSETDTEQNRREKPTTLKDLILSPIFFSEEDLKPARDCTPIEVFRDHRFQKLLGSKASSSHPLMERILEKDKDLDPNELRLAATYFEKALSRWHKKVARLERKVQYEHATGKEDPFNTEDLGRIMRNAARAFLHALEELGYEFSRDTELNANRYESIWNKIESIRNRLTSVVVYTNTPISKGSIAELLNIQNLRTVGAMHIPEKKDMPIYFGGSKRSDIACCTNGEVLLRNLKKIQLNGKEYEMITIKLSHTPISMIIPRGTAGIIGLKDLFTQAGILISESEVKHTPDLFLIGVPDEVFEGVEGIVQNKEGEEQQVDGGYKRFHYTTNDGSAVYVVGKGKDGNENELDYFGPYKKVWQLLATKQLKDATQLLARTGRPVTQPQHTKFKYFEGDREITNEEALTQMIMPFHGTVLFWGTTQAGTAQMAQRLDNNETKNHTIFEGQSGMGKSEMEQFIRMILKNLEHLHDTLLASEDPKFKRLASGLSPIKRLRLYSAGDDMGQLEVNELGELKSRTHERGRFTRLDNIPSRKGVVSRKTEPLNEKGTITHTTNTRVIEEDEELEAFHQVPQSARMFVLASNVQLEVANLDPTKPVQEVDFETYIKCYAYYKSQRIGTTDQDELVHSTGAMHEFMGQFSTAGSAACENAVAIRKFMLEHEMKRREECHMQRGMRFYIMNTGIKADWANGESNPNEQQKIAFANTARHWMDVDGLLPDEIKGAFIHAEKILGLNLGHLAYSSENWSETKLKSVLKKKTG
jgi:hypothetical protein